jgi:hypothetical protein
MKKYLDKNLNLKLSWGIVKQQMARREDMR